MATGTIHSAGASNSIDINDNIKNLARFAVEEYNKKENTLLEFKQVISAKEQVVSGMMYYITLEVTEGGKNKVYEAQVWVKPWENFKQLQEFKPVSDA
ncbi:hypothetical protein CDL12_26730 [Handroanthus impetiginosus]|uniref:Cysteine proteinase inhibitor n=1 Tax=Handroanthus impetiginosus TaxID=429701 RepID=A0A2G9G756_9LAMI|nr:hypothetical protein CDL12_26730 [Handroanthus impetiginosus]